jgi:tripartite-type tricarboxylate transporter receptor subunit TctC
MSIGNGSREPGATIARPAPHRRAARRADRGLDPPGYEIERWHILCAPAGTPAPIVSRLNAEVVKALQHPDLEAWMQRESAVPVGSPPAEASAFPAREVRQSARIGKASGAQPDQ